MLCSCRLKVMVNAMHMSAPGELGTYFDLLTFQDVCEQQTS